MGRDDEEHWVFGYGSLIWNPGFEFVERRRARLPGYARRFFQASEDHRGTPEHPGRVVTLLPWEGAVCDGVIYRIADRHWRPTLAYLDVREQGGYVLQRVEVLSDGERVSAITYIGGRDLPTYLGPDSLERMATQIATASGPSGHNRDYLRSLWRALDELDCVDPHVESLWAAVSRQIH